MSYALPLSMIYVSGVMSDNHYCYYYYYYSYYYYYYFYIVYFGISDSKTLHVLLFYR